MLSKHTSHYGGSISRDGDEVSSAGWQCFDRANRDILLFTACDDISLCEGEVHGPAHALISLIEAPAPSFP